jgi:hypothetical protein
MGRNSVEATNACRMRAARAALAARPDCALPLLPALAVFALFLGLAAAELPVGAVAPAVVCPATGDTASSKVKAAESMRKERGVEFGELTTLIFPL